MPIEAALDSPGPLTTQPMTASVMFSTPSYSCFHSGILSRMYPWMRSASSWKVVEVVRPQPGQAVTDGAKERIPKRLEQLAGRVDLLRGGRHEDLAATPVRSGRRAVSFPKTLNSPWLSTVKSPTPPARSEKDPRRPGRSQAIYSAWRRHGARSGQP